MEVYDLDGNKSKLDLKKYIVRTDGPAKSKLHKQCRELLIKLYPTELIVEEVKINTKGRDVLFLDFLIPRKMLSVEVQGEQHYKFSAHFHKSRIYYLKSLLRDEQKRNWCEVNDVKLVELPYNDIDNWHNLIAE